MNSKINTKKTTKPAFIADITNCNTVADTSAAIALAKHNAGIALSNENLYSLMYYVANATAENAPECVTVICGCCAHTKTPWYKRFWNKLKYAFTW